MSTSTEKPQPKRMGMDPLSWIRDSRESTPAPDSPAKSLQSLQGNSVLPSKPDVQSNIGKQGKRGVLSKHKTTQAGLRTGWTRATFIVREKHSESIKSLAYWERKDIKDILDEALSSFLQDKTVKPLPSRKAE